MHRILVLSLISFGFVLSGVALVNPFLVILSFPFILYLFSGLIFTQPELNLVVTRRMGTERAMPGQEVLVSLTIKNLGAGIHALLIDDPIPPQIELIDGYSTHLINLPSNETYVIFYKIIGERGYYSFNKTHIETRSFLGLNPRRRIISTKGELLILPKILNIQSIPIRPHWTRVYSGEIPSRTCGHGTDFFGIRQYQPGDPPNWINWHASARHPSRLYSNEFEQDKVSDVGIILDGRERVNAISPNISIYEHSIEAAAALSSAFIKQGNRVSLLKYGKYLDWIIPGYGKYQLEKILRALSKAEPGQSLVFSYLEYIPTQIFPPNSQIVLISPLAPGDPDILLQLRARGYQVLIISPDPISYERDSLPGSEPVDLAARILQIERKTLIEKLVRGGVQVLDWNINEPFQHAVNRLQNIHRIPRNTMINQ